MHPLKELSVANFTGIITVFDGQSFELLHFLLLKLYLSSA